MYTAEYGGEPLYDPRDPSLAVLDQSATLALTDAGSYSFTLPAAHPLAGRLEVMSRSREVVLYDDGDEVFRGRVRRMPERGIDGAWAYECEGERAYLNDVTLRPYACGAGGVPTSADALFAWYVARYNAAVPAADRFLLGVNEGRAIHPEEDMACASESRPTVWAELKECLVDALGGFVRVRHAGGARYIDWLADGTRECAQRVEFGSNLTEFAYSEDGTDLFTRVVPWARRADAEGVDDGGELGDGSPFRVALQPPAELWRAPGGEATLRVRAGGGAAGETASYRWYRRAPGASAWEAVEGAGSDSVTVAADAAGDGAAWRCVATGSSGRAATSGACTLRVSEHPDWFGLEPMDDGPLLEGYEKAGDAVVDVAAEAARGVIERAAEYDAADAEALCAAALRDLRNARVATALEVSAVDLHRVDPSVERIALGDFVRVTAEPLGFDAYMLCTSIDIDPADAASTYRLGTSHDTLTGAQASRLAALGARLSERVEAAEATSAEAKASASASRVVRSEVTYAAGDSGTDPPDGPWLATPPARAPGQWLWRRTVTVWADGVSGTGYDVSRDGLDAPAVELATTNGAALRNSRGSTSIRATVLLGGGRATDAAGLAEMLGASARLAWHSVSADGTRSDIDPADPRLSEGGFVLRVDAADVDGQATYDCDLEY